MNQPADHQGPVLLIFDFPARLQRGPEREAMLRDLAASIAEEPGLIWKIWTASATEGRAGGVYLFADRASAEAYHRMHAERLARMGTTGIEATYREVIEPLSRITRAPIP